MSNDNDNERPSTCMATEKGYYPTNSCPSKSKLDAAQSEYKKVVYVKVEDPNPALKTHIVSHVHPLFKATAEPPFCPRGMWKAVCCFFVLACLTAVILFIIDIINHI